MVGRAFEDYSEFRMNQMNLWESLDKITTLLKKSPTKILMLDFDGTLTPIVKSSEKVKLKVETKNSLETLSRKKGFYLAIISGRSLKDLKGKVALKKIIYAGNHGLEGEIYNKKFLYPVTKEVFKVMQVIKKDLETLVDKFDGVFIKDKKLTQSLHFRMLARKHLPLFKTTFNKIIKPYKTVGSVSVTAGKKVFDIRPKVMWNKGDFAKLVIKEIAKETKTTPFAIYIGDDVTDEDAFQTLEAPKSGVTIRVGGQGQSSAKYYLKNTKEVFKFLNWIVVNF